MLLLNDRSRGVSACSQRRRHREPLHRPGADGWRSIAPGCLPGGFCSIIDGSALDDRSRRHSPAVRSGVVPDVDSARHRAGGHVQLPHPGGGRHRNRGGLRKRAAPVRLSRRHGVGPATRAGRVAARRRLHRAALAVARRTCGLVPLARVRTGEPCSDIKATRDQLRTIAARNACDGAVASATTRIAGARRSAGGVVEFRGKAEPHTVADGFLGCRRPAFDGPERPCHPARHRRCRVPIGGVTVANRAFCPR